MSDELKYKVESISERIDKLVELNEKQTDKLVAHEVQLAKISATMDVNTQELHEHKEGVIQNRTHIKSLEVQLAAHNEQSKINTEAIEQDIKPILEASNAKKYLQKSAMTVGGILSLIVGILVGIAKLLGKI